MNNLEHIIAIVQPTNREDTTVDIARDVVANGGRATVVMLITDRVRKDIREFAEGEGLSLGEAEAMAIDRMSDDYIEAVGPGRTRVIVSTMSSGLSSQHPSLAGATTIAVGEQALSQPSLQRLVSGATIPVIVTPTRAA